jgi:nitronate monooxygenase
MTKPSCSTATATAPPPSSTATAKLLLSGQADPASLELASKLVGDEAVVLTSETTGGDRRASLTESTAYRRLLPPEALRQLKPRRALLVYGHLPPASCGRGILRGMLRTAFTELVGCQVPIQQAPMGGGVVTPELAVAVSKAGGLGMLQRAGVTPLADRIGRLEQAGAAPFGVNFVPALGQGDQAEVELAASRARLVEFFWAEPDPRLVELVHAGGALAGWQVGSLEEARRAVGAGCDLLVVQGMEAGGHVRGTVGLLPLLAGVRVGTRLLATAESGAHPEYVAALLAADGEATVLTEAFGVGWPDAPHRVLRSALEAAEAFQGEVVGTHTVGARSRPLARWAAQTPSREVTGTVAAMALYAGQGVGQVTRVVPAGQVVTELAQGAERLLGRWSGTTTRW